MDVLSGRLTLVTMTTISVIVCDNQLLLVVQLLSALKWRGEGNRNALSPARPLYPFDTPWRGNNHRPIRVVPSKPATVARGLPLEPTTASWADNYHCPHSNKFFYGLHVVGQSLLSSTLLKAIRFVLLNKCDFQVTTCHFHKHICNSWHFSTADHFSLKSGSIQFLFNTELFLRRWWWSTVCVLVDEETNERTKVICIRYVVRAELLYQLLCAVDLKRHF
jgi:hypothetical protein